MRENESIEGSARAIVKAALFEALVGARVLLDIEGLFERSITDVFGDFKDFTAIQAQSPEFDREAAVEGHKARLAEVATQGEARLMRIIAICFTAEAATQLSLTDDHAGATDIIKMIRATQYMAVA